MEDSEGELRTGGRETKSREERGSEKAKKIVQRRETYGPADRKTGGKEETHQSQL